MPFLRCIESQATPAEDARSLVLELASLCGTPAWTIQQSFEAFLCERWTGQLPHFDKVFNGRIFGPDAEIRWIREGTDWSIYQTSESGEGQPVQSHSRKYFLWGVYQPGSKNFLEDRIPSVPNYPIEFQPKDQARAYVEVIEYTKDLAEVNSPAELVEQLNQPRLCAHRLVALHSGSDDNQEGEE